MVFNEEYILPFFFRHYNQFVDKYYILYDKDSTDLTLEIVREQAKTKEVEIIPFEFPDGYDDIIRVDKINNLYEKITDCSWICCPDADEFIFPLPLETDVKEILQREQDKGFNLVKTHMWQVYRNVADEDLDPNKMPIVTQRRYGDPRLDGWNAFYAFYVKPIIVRAGMKISRFVRRLQMKTSTQNKMPIVTQRPRLDGWNAFYVKPIIVRAGMRIGWAIGTHKIAYGSYKESDYKMAGSHWANADPCFCVDRRVKNRRDRFSKRNMAAGMGCHDHGITEQDVLDLCSRHINDPKLF
jgi:hypothetical protein